MRLVDDRKVARAPQAGSRLLRLLRETGLHPLAAYTETTPARLPRALRRPPAAAQTQITVPQVA